MIARIYFCKNRVLSVMQLFRSMLQHESLQVMSGQNEGHSVLTLRDIIIVVSTRETTLFTIPGK